jgi:amino acid adenylation domain-containing protein
MKELSTNTVDFNPFLTPEIELVAPATEPQLEIWLSSRIGGDDANRSYNQSVSLRLNGSLSEGSLLIALQNTVQRHQAMRMVFSSTGEELIIFKELDFAVEQVDLSASDEEEQKAFILQTLHNNAHFIFDLSRGPLFIFQLFKLSKTEHLFTLTIHHIIGDGWSIGILLTDISKFYNAFSEGVYPTLEPAPSFVDYAVDQWDFSQSQAYSDTENYWIKRFQTVPEVNLPLDFSRPAHRTYAAQRNDYVANTAVINHLKLVGSKAGCSFVTTLIAAFEIFLHRLTGQSETVVGLPVAGQYISGLNGLVGHCVNLLPLKSSYSPELSFMEYLQKRKSELFDDYENQQITFGSLLKRLDINREGGRLPLVPLVLNVDLGLDNGVAFNGIKHSLIYNPRKFENFEIFLNVSGSEKELVFEWSFNTQLFKPATITRFMDSLEAMIGFITANPNTKIGEIEWAENSAFAEKLAQFNNTKSVYNKDVCITELIEKNAALYPDKVAINFEGTIVNYSDLVSKTNRLANYLIKQGIGPGNVVALSVDRSERMVIALLAILKTGAAYLPLDPDYPKKRIEYIIDNAKAQALITSKKYQGYLETTATVFLLEDALVESESFSDKNFKTAADGESLAYLLYTSGSTGNPKGVLVQRHSLFNFLLSMQKEPGIKYWDKFLAVTTISFDIAGLELFLPLISGSLLLLASNDAARDGRMLLDLVKKNGVTMMQGTPATYKLMIDAGWNEPLPVKVLCGGEAFPSNLATALSDRSASVWNMYGPTETTIWSMVERLYGNESTITIGKPIDNTQVYVLDDQLRLLLEGAVGEIFIAGEGVARGYYNLAEQTASRFVTNPFSEEKGARMYRTGDLGRFVDNGKIQCLGRKDQQVKVRGYRIELGEIEHTLLQQSGIKEAAVIAHNNRLIAYLVTESNPDTSAWKQAIRSFLPPYMMPSEFVVIEKMPLTPNGKIDKLALPKSDKQTDVVVEEFIGPRTETEKLVAKIWCEVLELKEISITSDFFEVGGHSLITIQIVNRLEKEIGKRIPLAWIFENTTIERFSWMIDSENKPFTWDTLVPLKATGTKVPIYLVHGFDLNILPFTCLARNMEDDQPVYGLQAMGLSGQSDPYDNMIDLAAHYVKEIVLSNPKGPYAIVGYSFGGVIAFEIAQQLKAMGKEVSMLAMFDSYAENLDYYSPKTQRIANKLRRQLPKFSYIVKSFFKRPITTIKYQYEWFTRRLNQFTSKVKVEDMTPEQRHIQEIMWKYERAYLSYNIQKFDGSIDLFRVSERLYWLEDPETMGWKPYVTEQVNVHPVLGDHKTFLLPPNDKDFAQILQKVLNEKHGYKN